MKKTLQYAFRAFWTILLGKPHIYADNEGADIKGSPFLIEECLKKVNNLYDDGLGSLEILEEAERILNNKK